MRRERGRFDIVQGRTKLEDGSRSNHYESIFSNRCKHEIEDAGRRVKEKGRIGVEEEIRRTQVEERRRTQVNNRGNSKRNNVETS